jgi:cobalt/nickel transport system permease protein
LVHISDGVLPPEILITGFALTAVLLYLSLKNIIAEEIPKISMITSAVFVASLVHFPVGPTSVHLIMNGLAGIILGKRAFASIFVALTLQAIFFQYGGMTVIGVNTLNMGLPALLAWQIFEQRRGFHSPKKEMVFGGIAGGAGVLGAVVMLSAELLSLGTAFKEITVFVLAAHVPIILIETVVVGAMAGLLQKVKPEMLIPAKNGSTVQVNENVVNEIVVNEIVR